MKIVIDTNVLISGIFFAGSPSEIIDACIVGKYQLVMSFEILEEYHRVGEIFSGKHPNIDFERFLNILLSNSVFVEPVNLQQQVCRDPDDDKFISCAISGKAEVIVSGDKDLLSVSGITGMKVLRPIEFKKSYLNLS